MKDIITIIMSTTTEQLRIILINFAKTRVILYNEKYDLIYGKLILLKDTLAMFKDLKILGLTNFEEFQKPEIFDFFEFNETILSDTETDDLNKMSELFISFQRYSKPLKEFIKYSKYESYIINLLEIYKMYEKTDENMAYIIKIRQIQAKINKL